MDRYIIWDVIKRSKSEGQDGKQDRREQQYKSQL